MHSFPIPIEELVEEPLERASTIPSTWYTDRAIFDLERESIFGRTWQFVGSVGQLPEAGSHLTTEIGKEPLIIVRGKDGINRAFYNVCRHRGGPLATGDGCASMLKCHYHGWTYTLDGMLRGVPDFDRVELFDKKDFGLIPLELVEWQGLLFSAIEPPAISLSEILSGIDERVRNVDLTSLKFFKRDVYEVECNWKVYVDNYLEGYHVPIVHPELFRIYDFNRYTTETHEWYSFQHSPLSDTEVLYSQRLRPGVAREALYYFVYPNLMLNILPGRLQTNLVQPLAPNKCRVTFDYYYEDVSSPGALSLIEQDIAFSDLVQKEDVEICELVQRGLESRAYNRGRFSVKRENAVHHFQLLLKRAFREAHASNAASEA